MYVNECGFVVESRILEMKHWKTRNEGIGIMILPD